jgi:hypothetical protein
MTRWTVLHNARSTMEREEREKEEEYKIREDD